MALGQTMTLANNLLAGRVTGAPWWRNVRKGLIIRNPTQSAISYKKDILETYPQHTGTRLLAMMKSEAKRSKYIYSPGNAFKDRFDALVGKDSLSNSMWFMYNPTSWKRSIKSGITQIDIPGGRPVFHQSHIPPQTFSLQLLLDNTLWYSADTLAEIAVDTAIGAGSRALGGLTDLGLREAQFYQSPSDKVDPFFSQSGNTNYASLAPIIQWYETLAVPDSKTRTIPEVSVCYQDMFARCLVESVETEIIRSDWRQNITRALLSLNFIVLDNLNLHSGNVGTEKNISMSQYN